MKTVYAYPRPYSVDDGGDFIISHEAQDGMTLRDYFAGQALAGMAQLARDDEADRMAHYCFIIADAMLKARDK